MLLLLLACAHPAADDAATPDSGSDSGPDGADSGADPGGDSGGDSGADSGADSGGDSGADSGGDSGGPAAWNVLVYMDADNDLEPLFFKDLNELERGGSDARVNVLVQVDRAEGYSTADGDWTGGRRYRIVHDEDDDTVVSPVIEELGEIDMGVPATVTDFLEWAAATYPAERTFLSFWDHGDGWSATDEAPAPPSIAWDEESDHVLSIAAGDLGAALDPYVATHGPLDIVAFDACNMAQWEVGWALHGRASVMVASEAWVNTEGLMYAPFIDRLRADPDQDARTAAASMPGDSVGEGGEFTFSAVDVDALADTTATLDAMAAWGLDDPAHRAALLDVRADTRGADATFWSWYLDLRDFAAQARAHAEATADVDPDASAVAAFAADLDADLDATVLVSEAHQRYEYVGGLSFFYVFDNAHTLGLYAQPTAPWATDTRWDELLLAHYADTHGSTAR